MDRNRQYGRRPYYKRTAVFFCGSAGEADRRRLLSVWPLTAAQGFESPDPRLCSHGGTGRHGGFKPRCPQGVRVRIPLGAFFVDTIRFRSRIGICAGLRTRAGMTTAGSSPAGSIMQEWRNRHTRPPQKRCSEGPNPSSCTLSGCLERYTGMAQNHVSFETCGSESRSGYHAVMPQPVPGRS